MAPQAKKIRVRCKDAGFTPESLNKSPFFFAKQKRKMAPQAKKILVNSASEASGNFFGVYFRERSEQKKIEVPS